MKATLKLGLTGPDVNELFRRVQSALLPDAGPPSSISLSGRKKKVTPDWFEKWSAEVKGYLMAEWKGRGWLRLDPGRIVKTWLDDYELDPRRLLEVLADLPFTVGSTAPMYDGWFSNEEYERLSLGQLHWPHGWGCFFRGEGHDHLVSRRWLDFGPWRLLRGAGDVSLVQFHDLAADSANALAQSRPGHERMGISDTGGFIHDKYSYSQDLKGLYYAAERKMHVVVPFGEAVSQREMLDACAIRFFQGLGSDKPLDNVVYVFVDDESARAHLHELWLRGLECRAFVEGVETRLDEDYQPSPVKPDWVVRLDRSDSDASHTT